MILEACVETMEEAIRAEFQGADRIELCADLRVGGITPSYALLESVTKKINIPVMVMIRPRGGDFVYSEEELQQMEKEIDIAKNNGAAGLVFGLLTPENKIDIVNTERLVRRAAPLSVTFHKAIDCLADPVEGVLALMEIKGITRILTSGGKPTAREGANVIREMIDKSGDALTILVAGRVTDENVKEIAELTGANELHGRKINENVNYKRLFYRLLSLVGKITFDYDFLKIENRKLRKKIRIHKSRESYLLAEISRLKQVEEKNEKHY